MPLPAPIVVGPQTCGSLQTGGGADREWLVTDGRGGFATGTVAGLRTRRAHCLLTVPGPAGPRAALASLDLTLTLPSGARVPLYTHGWESGAVEPAGHQRLESFELADGPPRWRWRVGDVVVERKLALARDRGTLAVVHRVLASPGPVGLAVTAMCTWRDTDTVRLAAGGPLAVSHFPDGAVVEDAFRLAGPGWQAGGGWHLGAYLQVDDDTEDLWAAGTFVARPAAGEIMEITAWALPQAALPPPARVVVADARRRGRSLADPLLRAADHFVVRAEHGPDVVTAYPRPVSNPDAAAAAYEGLFLDAGREEEGRELLLARTPSLWLAHAADRHVTRTGDTDVAAALGPKLQRMLESMPVGDDELVRTEGGKPVALNALWVNALGAVASLLDEAGDDGDLLRKRREAARASFAARFRAPEGWLYDLVDGPAAAYPLGAGAFHDDPSLRPGQLFAWSLPHAPLTSDFGALAAVAAALLTPLGPRTLSPEEYGYAPDGDGSVRPWLIGALVDARAAVGQPVAGLISGLVAHLGEAGLESVSESASGDAPHHPAGAPFAALSVAELLRVHTKGVAG